MAEDLTEAISFVEYYAGLVDGIFPGLRNQLAKNVVLQWFGETFKENEHITSFMRHDNRDIFHTFIEIIPSLGIKKKLQQRYKPNTSKCSSDETKSDYARSDINVELELKEELKSPSKSIRKKCCLAENDTMKYIEAKGEIVFKWKGNIVTNIVLENKLDFINNGLNLKLKHIDYLIH